MINTFFSSHHKIRKRFRRIRKILNFSLNFPLINNKVIGNFIDITNDIISTTNRTSSIINYYNFNGYNRKSEKLFILGSGASVNKLTTDHWAEIKKHDSFSFNYFLVSGIVGDLHFIESSAVPEHQSIYYDAIIENKNLQDTDYIINQLHFTDSVLKPYTEIQHLFFFQNPFRFTSSNSRIIKALLKFGKYFLPIDDPNFGIHHSSSVCYLINLGVRLGFKHIVLIGIDLNNTDYFFYFQESNLAKKLTKIYKSNLEDQSIHRTANQSITSSYKAMSTPNYIKLYYEVVCRKRGVKLEVANPNSLLAEFLGIYKFSS